MHLSPVWLLLLLGLAAQAVFFIWTLAPRLRRNPEASESPNFSNPKETPWPWWLIALAGGICIVIFAALRRDAVLLVGQCFVLILYLRHMPRGAGTVRPAYRDED